MHQSPASNPMAANEEIGVNFSGKGGEFFKIWIVNILFSILTLGIYSAWAKVRTTQYFHSNTSIDGHRFRYLAKPIQILKGRILAVAVFVAFSLLSAFNPALSLILALALFFAFPWLLIQGLRFNMRMTSYRNVRFSFHASYGETFVTFMILPIIGALSLYLAFPWVLKKIDQFIHSSISYGNKPLAVDTSTGTYYLAALAALGSAVVLIFVLIFLSAIIGIGSFASSALDPSFQSAVGITGVAVMVLAYWLGFSVAAAVYQSMIRNHLFASMTLEDVAQFRSEVRVLPYAWIQFSNALLLIITLGLAYPITKIRKTRYLANATYVTLLPGANEVVDQLEDKASVFGEEAAEVFDVDFAIG